MLRTCTDMRIERMNPFPNCPPLILAFTKEQRRNRKKQKENAQKSRSDNSHLLSGSHSCILSVRPLLRSIFLIHLACSTNPSTLVLKAIIRGRRFVSSIESGQRLVFWASGMALGHGSVCVLTRAVAGGRLKSGRRGPRVRQGLFGETHRRTGIQLQEIA